MPLHAPRSPAVPGSALRAHPGSHRPAGPRSAVAGGRAATSVRRGRVECSGRQPGSCGPGAAGGQATERAPQRRAERGAAAPGCSAGRPRARIARGRRRPTASDRARHPPRAAGGAHHRRPGGGGERGLDPPGGSPPVPRSRMTTLQVGDEGYPACLRQIHDPPARLFVQGRLPAEEMIAIVGSRRATPYGLRVAYRLAADLSQCGVVVVSGLARGVDAAAHRGALSGPTPTVAVMATGLDRIYPPEHADLAAQIARTGALVTEAPDGTPPLPARFPVRNRIICGLSKGGVVVEAAARSGALITANMAGREGREVFAVPGSIENPLTEGTHALIDDGAKLVRDVDDILEEFPTLARVHARAQTDTRTRARIQDRTRRLFAMFGNCSIWIFHGIMMRWRRNSGSRRLNSTAGSPC